MTKRVMGGRTFATVLDGGGTIQLMGTRDGLGSDDYAVFKELDLGDIVGAEGPMVRTRTGEPSVDVAAFQLLSKALRPLPEKWHGLKDVELRYRQRHVDLIANPEVREVFIARSRIVAGLRRHMDEHGFLEVETPVLQDIPGGGLARPFRTHHNALDMDLYMRIALELHLKRLIVGGIEKVYEIGRVFRNEGLSPRHNPEFTMFESYEAYADYEDVMRFAEELIPAAITAAGRPLALTYQGEELDFTPPYPRRKMADLIREATGIDVLTEPDLVGAANAARGGDRAGCALGLCRQRALREEGRGHSPAADAGDRLPDRCLAARPPARGRPPLRRALRAGGGRPGALQRVHRADRPG